MIFFSVFVTSHKTAFLPLLAPHKNIYILQKKIKSICLHSGILILFLITLFWIFSVLQFAMKQPWLIKALLAFSSKYLHAFLLQKLWTVSKRCPLFKHTHCIFCNGHIIWWAKVFSLLAVFFTCVWFSYSVGLVEISCLITLKI